MQLRIDAAVKAAKDAANDVKGRMRTMVEDAQDETRRSIDQVDDQVKEVERGVKKDTNTLKKAEQKLTSKALSLTGKALGLVGDIARSESDSVKDGENLEAEMAEETSTFEDMVTKDTASAIDKFTKNSEQLGVPPISELIRVNCNLFWTKQGSFLITESANLRKVGN